MGTVGFCANTFIKMDTENAQLALMLKLVSQKAFSWLANSRLRHLLLTCCKYNANQLFFLPGSLINDINKYFT